MSGSSYMSVGVQRKPGEKWPSIPLTVLMSTPFCDAMVAEIVEFDLFDTE